MSKTSKYQAKIPDENGIIHYTEEEHSVWHDLITRQLEIIQSRACPEFLDGLQILDLPTDRIPQPGEVSQKLLQRTGWQVEPALASISTVSSACWRKNVSRRLRSFAAARKWNICRNPTSFMRYSVIPPC